MDFIHQNLEVIDTFVRTIKTILGVDFGFFATFLCIVFQSSNSLSMHILGQLLLCL
jgi:hypothetical protein